MSVSRVKEFLEKAGLMDGYVEMEQGTQTVALAAQALHIEPGRVAKTLSLKLPDRVIAVIARGDARVDNKKFKETFHAKARFLAPDEVEELTGHPVGGVCPFALKDGVEIYLDVSLKDFDPVYPAAGSVHNAVRISLSKLEEVTNGTWVDICG